MLQSHSAYAILLAPTHGPTTAMRFLYYGIMYVHRVDICEVPHGTQNNTKHHYRDSSARDNAGPPPAETSDGGKGKEKGKGKGGGKDKGAKGKNAGKAAAAAAAGAETNGSNGGGDDRGGHDPRDVSASI